MRISNEGAEDDASRRRTTTSKTKKKGSFDRLGNAGLFFSHLIRKENQNAHIARKHGAT